MELKAFKIHLKKLIDMIGICKDSRNRAGDLNREADKILRKADKIKSIVW